MRLAFAPESRSAFFGGDPDNFNFPRYDLDFSFLRLYENGRPVSTPQHLHWNASAPKEGDSSSSPAIPARTDRAADRAAAPDPARCRLPAALIAIVRVARPADRAFAEDSPEHARISSRSLFGVENTIKALRGAQLALLDPALIDVQAQGRRASSRRASTPIRGCRPRSAIRGRRSPKRRARARA